MASLLLGIDIGTSACKVAVFTPDGELLAQATHSYPTHYPRPGFVEQMPDDWWRAACAGVGQCLSAGGFDAGDIAAVGVDGHSWSCIPVDRDGRVLAADPIWMDTRSEAICTQLHERHGAQRLFSVCRNPLTANYTTGKLLWFKRHDPQLYARTHMFLQSNSYITLRLTGAFTHDMSSGYALHFFDMARMRYDAPMCDLLGLDLEKIPPLFACDRVVGTVTAEAARACGLRAGTPVVAGAVDAMVMALGSGTVDVGCAQEQGGQAGGMAIVTQSSAGDERLIIGPYVLPNTWILQGGMVGGGSAMRWFGQEFGAHERMLAEQAGTPFFDELTRAAGDIPPGSDGLVFLPYLRGERSPLWDAHAKGVYFGISFATGKAHFMRALMEGCAFALRHNIETAEAAGNPVGDMIAVGGSANSRLWTQIKADVTGKRIHVGGGDAIGCLGTAMIAGVGAGVYPDYLQAVRRTQRILRTHEPDAAAHARYAHTYGIYRELYGTLKDTMRRADRAQG